ncbi:MAG: ATP-binding cassette domain-containing protein [Alphaproteobacteria bacterium]|jgi:ATP-binding cassette subfamily F protein 3|nr:ATP-binding cassette domain-containing protein [Alphaproteobacteria bacterium]
MLEIKNLELSFGKQKIFDKSSFKINSGERVGLAGLNGSGKSTLFRILTGELENYDGEINTPSGYKIGHLEQHLNFTKPTVLEEACLGLREEDYYNEWKVEKILSGLGFTIEDFYRDPNEFSGGFQVRLNLAKCLAGEPDLLLLDEPTNYLDIVSIRWLVSFLKKWPNELILITHDRNNMNSITTHSMAIHRQKMVKCEGNTVKLYEQIALEEEMYMREVANDARRREEIEKFVNRFRSKASLASRVQSRIKQLDKMGKKEELSQIKTLGFTFNEEEFRARNLMKFENLTFGYEDGENLIENLSLHIEKDDRVCIIGRNGKGKSTLMKVLVGELEAKSGEVTYHPNCKIGYFGQTNIERLDPNNNIIDELFTARGGLTNTEVYSTAGAMLFSGELAKKRISVLSGGEKSRVSLGKILLNTTNLLMLDEPTNHLDADSCDSLINAIDNFDGGCVIVTHNEMFLHHLATKLVVFDDGKVSVFNGTYKEWLDKVGWAE